MKTPMPGLSARSAIARVSGACCQSLPEPARGEAPKTTLAVRAIGATPTLAVEAVAVAVEAAAVIDCRANPRRNVVA